MVSLELATRERDGQLVVALRGELDVADAASVVTALTEFAAPEHQVIVDLEDLEFIDSSGLYALVRAREHARRAGGDLLLAAPQQQILRVLALTRLIEVFTVYACVEEAAGSSGRTRPLGATAAVAPVHPRGDMILARLSVPAGPEHGDHGTPAEHRQRKR
jgi:anti-sigma B factor antagonist